MTPSGDAVERLKVSNRQRWADTNSPKTLGDASTLRWGLLDSSITNVDGSGVWTLALDENAYGNVYAPGTGSIRFQGVPGSDTVFGNGFEPN